MSDRNEEFDDYLDSISETEVTIFGLSYQPSDVLYRVDPIAYSVMLSDWESEQEEEHEWHVPGVCSAEDAWDSMEDSDRKFWWSGDREYFIKAYNVMNNLS